MRVSVYKDDAGYPQWLVAKEHGKKVHVFLDGEEVECCSTADSDKGYVERCVLDADGNIQHDPLDDDEVWTERVRGTVEIVFEAGVNG